MRLLPVWAVTVAGWVVSAAPGPAHTTTHVSPPTQPRENLKGADLGPALQDLARRKRGNNKPNLPYSNYRPVTGIHRYRYPLYKKRSYPPQYDYEEDLLLPEDDFTYDRDDSDEGDSNYYAPSLFRERNREQNSIFEDDGYFTNDYYPLEDPERPLRKKDYMYHLYNLPAADLERLNHMYEIGKRDLSDLPPGVRLQLHGVGRKTYAPSATERFYDAIDFVDDDEEDRKRKRTVDSNRGEKLRKLQSYLTSAAGQYWRGRELEGNEGRPASDPMIRKKRDANKKRDMKKKKTTTTTTTPASKTLKTAKNSSLHSAKSLSQSSPSLRDKRAFSDYFKWEKKRNSSPSSYDDYLTREYFKSIARSVGQKKKKRMAYAQFEPDFEEEVRKRSEKRSEVKRAGYNMDELLRSPSMLRFMQDKLKEAEEVVAREAEGEVRVGDTDKLLSNIVIRLDALEGMRAALHQLEELQEQEEARKKRNGNVEEEQKKKKKKREEEEEKEESERRRRGGNKRSVRRRLRRGDDDIGYLFMGNSREDCPVLERLVVNCEGVSSEVGDDDEVFLPHCLRHEICYMCGAGESVTGHECDAILSSGLESACSRTMSLATSRSLDCLSAAGTTFSMLSDHSRYDNDGVCTDDPCVRRFLESR